MVLCDDCDTQGRCGFEGYCRKKENKMDVEKEIEAIATKIDVEKLYKLAEDVESLTAQVKALQDSLSPSVGRLAEEPQPEACEKLGSPLTPYGDKLDRIFGHVISDDYCNSPLAKVIRRILDED